MTRTRTTSLSIALLLGLGAIGAVNAAGNSGSAPGPVPRASRAYLHSFNLDSRGLALEGYCPVSYFTEGLARPGSPAHTSTFNGVDYRFATLEAKRAFDEDPERYVPAYGGWCAYGMAVEDKFPIDPTNFKIVDGRLMVFLRNVNVDALAKWNQGDERAQVRTAEAHWKKVSG